MASHIQIQNVSSIVLTNRKFVSGQFHTVELQVHTTDSPNPVLVTLFATDPISIDNSELAQIEIP